MKKTPAEKDLINPSHYKSDNGIEAIDAIRAALGKEGLTYFLRGQVLKYNWRLGKKDAPLQEAKKAKWYADKLVEVLSEE